MNRKEKLIVALLAILLLWSMLAPLIGQSDRPKARQGVLDLTGWSFSNGSVKLDGEWEWFPHEFVAAGQAGGAASTGYIKVPGIWDEAFGNERHRTPDGAGTYRLQVLLPEQPPSYLALRVTNIRNSHDLYLNGKKIGSSGTPTLHPDGYVPRNHTYIAGTDVAERRLEIVVHVANYSYLAGGGFFQPIWLGSMESISRMKSLSVGADMTAAIVFFTIGFIAALAYLLFHRRRELLVFALLNLSVMQFVLTHGEKLMYTIWPELDYEWMTKLQMLSVLQTCGFILSLVSMLSLRRSERFAGKLLQAFFAIYGVFVLLAPAAWFTRTNPQMLAITIVGYLFIFYTLLRAVWNKHRQAFFIMISTLGVMAAGLNQLMNEIDIRKPVFDPSFEYVVFMVGLVLLLFDTYMKALIDARKLSRSLIRSDQQKNDFLTDTSYELRTPIHTLLNLCHTLLLEGERELGVRQRQDVLTIAAVGRRMARLLDDMLELASTNEEKSPLAAQPLSVGPVVSAVLEMMSPLKGDKPIRFVNLVPDGPVVLADEGRLVQILTHMISNAVMRLPAGTITVSAEMTASEVRITLRDEGSGPEAGDPVAQAGKPVGDALAELRSVRVTKRLAELQGGTITERAHPDKGTTSVLTLPVARVGSAEAAVDLTDARESPGGKGTVLIIADNSPNLQLMVKLLRSEHYRTAVMSRPDDVFEQLQGSFSYDLVLLDTSLPVMNGYKLCRLIRLRFSESELPVLLMTANGGPEDVAAVFEAGANDYVVKPIDPVECSARIRGAIQLRQSIEERIRLELALVQAQLKPHFLYNTLNTIAALSEVDQDRTRELLMHFGEYLRASFDKRNMEPLVPFETELELVRNYLHIEHTRFGDRLKVEYDGVEGPWFQIPPLTLQPIVENGIRHGLMKKSGGGTLRISIDRSNPHHIEVSVTDDGAGIDPARIEPLLEGTASGGIGLYNTHKRLLHAFGQGLLIQRLPAGGTQVSMRIPKSG